MAALAFLLFQFGPKLFGGGKPHGSTAEERKPARAERDAACARADVRRQDAGVPRAADQPRRSRPSLRALAARSIKSTRSRSICRRRRISSSTASCASTFTTAPACQRAKSGTSTATWSIGRVESKDGKSCVFSYRDAKVELTKTVSATGRPYELAVEATIKNLGDQLALSLAHRAQRHLAHGKRREGQHVSAEPERDARRVHAGGRQTASPG